MTTLVATSIPLSDPAVGASAASEAATGASRRASLSLTSDNTCDNGTSSAPQMAASSSLEASLRPRSTSDRYPRLTRAESDTSRSVLPCPERALRRVSPMASRSNSAMSISLTSVRVHTA
ncbi:Uncharacterised protein [Mycobacteroides abscessus subsp. abscessus]|nr:Uncharacterised protein [Mycobacteroides abscessus subsp. abscessus]